MRQPPGVNGNHWPQDVIALPDGDVAVLALSKQKSVVARVNADDTIVWQRTYERKRDAEANVGVWDAERELLFLGGSARDSSGTQMAWTLALDPAGDPRCE